MTIAIIIIIAVVVIALIVAVVIAAKRRKETQMDARRVDARDTRDLAKASGLEADRVTAEAEERAARAKRESVAAEQQQMAAAAHRSNAEDLQSAPTRSIPTSRRSL